MSTKVPRWLAGSRYVNITETGSTNYRRAYMVAVRSPHGHVLAHEYASTQSLADQLAACYAHTWGIDVRNG